MQSIRMVKKTYSRIVRDCQTFIKEKLDKWCEELGYKDTTVNMFTLSRSLNISRNELSRYFTSCLNSTFRLWLAEVRFEAAKKMMLDSPTSVMTSFLPSVASLPVPISTVCSKRKKAALLRLGERKTVKKYVLGVAFPHECDTFFVGMRHLVSKKNTIFAP